MKVFITGATGFLGTAVTRSVLAAGHDVIAMARRPPAKRDPWDHDRVEVVLGDLRRPADWREAIARADVVVHLAAVTSGSIHDQFGGTVLSTETLLGVLADLDDQPRLVHISTFSVYDYDALPAGGQLDETSPIVVDPEGRGAYCETKLIQERLVRDHAAETGAEFVVLRPGAVWGAGAWWDGGLALAGGRVGLAFGPGSEMKSVYVENCADAIAAAVAAPDASGATINVVDGPQPTQREFHAAVRDVGVPVPPAVPVPYAIVRLFAAAVDLVDRVVFGGRLRKPEFADSARLPARYKPLRYSNDLARTTLSWEPRYGLSEACRRAAAADPDLGSSVER